MDLSLGLVRDPTFGPLIVVAADGAVAALSTLTLELDALDINPLICDPADAVAVDALAIAR